MDVVSKINGNTVSATEFNQIATELEALQTSSGQTSSDAILNQISIATSRYAANNFYIDSGTANAYLLSLASSMTNPVSATVGYFVGMTIRFRAGNGNTGGAATVNVNGAGVKSLKKEDGTTDPIDGDISTTRDSTFRYNGTCFVSTTDTRLPTVTIITSGSSIYSTPTNVVRLSIDASAAGGGGGGGGSTGGSSGGTGGNTTFGSIISCVGGSGGANGAAAGLGGAGGSATLTGVSGQTIRGGGGVGGVSSAVNANGVCGAGGVNIFGGSGAGSSGTLTATAAQTNSGAGGGGGGANNNNNSGGGGGAGGAVRNVVVNNPGASYSYSVGAAGAAGTAGTTGGAGGAGGSGVIYITEFYY